MSRIYLLISIILLSSCSFYKTSFDCPPGVGVKCKSVTEIENMIIEHENGPDEFIGVAHLQKVSLCQKQNTVSEGYRLWMEGVMTEDGNQVGGHYVYFNLED